ncbi:MAG: hypothetical protein ACK5Q5_22340 [Planctomycetaceae bacterium]
MHTKTFVSNSESQELRELEEEIASWRNWWSELSQIGQPHFGEMGDRLALFRRHLSAHFQHQEFHGPLAGHSDDDVAALWRDHALLLAELDVLVDRLHRCGPDVGCWGTAGKDVERLLEWLHQHEVRESQLVAALT